VVGELQQKSRFPKESGHQPHPLIDSAVSYVTGFGRDSAEMCGADLVSPTRMSILGVGVLRGLFAAGGLGILFDL
jgi:hypothetical protein